MKLDALLKIAKVLPLFALLVVYGCGGGSGTTATAPSTTQPGSGTEMPGSGTEMPGSGTEMPGSGGGPAHEGPTLTEAFATQQDQNYSLSNASLTRDINADTTSISNSFRVTSIQRTSAGGYTVAFQDRNDEGTATFLPEHCVQTPGYCSYTDTGQYYGFWSATGTSDGEMLGAPSEFTYLAALQLDVHATRSYFVFGLGTAAPAIPATGEAIYSGRFRADAYRAGSASNNFRQRYSGNVRLVANFDMSQLTGQIFRVFGSAPGSSTRNSWPTSSFTVTNGQFSNGQFTATLTGMDSDSAVPDAESVRGFMGQIVARFYGPNAEEIGGTITAARDLANTDNDLNLYGFVGGTKVGPPSVLGSSAIMVGVNRDSQNQMTEVLQDDGNATLERIDNGWRLSVGGRTFEFSDSDFEANLRFRRNYTRQFSDALVVMGSFTNGTLQNREFNHFDVMGWGTAEPDLATTNSAQIGLLVYGDRTAASAVPSSSTATYSGRMEARDFPTDNAVQTFDPAYTHYLGNVTLEADFSNAAVTGEFTDLRSRPGNGSYSSVAGGATFNATVSGNIITASDLTGTGALAGYQNGRVRGSFFGPAADEAAGAFDAQDATNRRAIFGFFGTSKTE